MKNFKFVCAPIILLMIALTFVGCAPKGITDSDYTITFIVDDVEYPITKGAILALETIEYNEDNPIYASDKTDELGNKVPHTVKGVLLETVFDAVGLGNLTDYYSMHVIASDNYEKTIDRSVFENLEVIVAYEYDDDVFAPDSDTGSLRLVVPNAPQNSWCRKIKTIHLSTNPTIQIQPSTILFIDELSTDLSSFEEDGYMHTGFFIADLTAKDILPNKEDFSLFARGWDVDSGSGTVHDNLLPYSYYSGAYIITSSTDSSATLPVLAKPNPPGADLKGMKVSNLAFLSVGDVAIVSLPTMFKKLALHNIPSSNIEGISLFELLEDVYALNGIGVVLHNDNADSDEFLSKNELENAYIVKDEDSYQVHYAKDTSDVTKSVFNNLKSITVKIN